jgi:hypothetical protein
LGCRGWEGYVVGAYVDSIQLIANGFECPVCRLALAGGQLSFANLEQRQFSEGDFDGDLANTYFEAEPDDDWD